MIFMFKKWEEKVLFLRKIIFHKKLSVFTKKYKNKISYYTLVQLFFENFIIFFKKIKLLLIIF